MKRIITILSISLLFLGGCTTKQVAEAPINTVEETTVKEIAVKETTIETTKVEETTVVEETISDEIKTLMDKYNGLTKDQILAMDGWLDDNDTLYKNGKYIVFLQETQKAKIMGEQEAKTYFETLFNEGKNYDIVGTSETNKLKEEVLGKIKKKQSDAQAEAFSNEVSSHIKTGSGVATVINDLNPYGYTTNNLGYVVQNEQAVAHMKSLKGNERRLYESAEMEAFKKNNAGKINIVNGGLLSTNYSQGTFDSYGNILWVCREANFETTTALGIKVYAGVNYGYEEFRPYCDGTTVAFKGWGDNPCNPNAEKEWCDEHNLLDKSLGAFVDWNWDWVGEVGERKFRKVN